MGFFASMHHLDLKNRTKSSLAGRSSIQNCSNTQVKYKDVRNVVEWRHHHHHSWISDKEGKRVYPCSANLKSIQNDSLPEHDQSAAGCWFKKTLTCGEWWGRTIRDTLFKLESNLWDRVWCSSLTKPWLIQDGRGKTIQRRHQRL